MTARPMPGPFRYDLMLLIASRGKERIFREKQVDLARLAPGESVLDVGCGTGTLAIAAARRLGSAGAVHGLDRSAALLARARKKAHKAGVDVTFELGSGEALPYPDGHFEVVLSSLVFHHLPHEVLQDSAREIRRVLKANGRLLIVDIGGVQDHGKRTMHAPHAGRVAFNLAEVAPRLSNIGLEEVESGPIDSHMTRLERLHYILATAV
jgi:ubiquinone/menaquinone biosynthesis C-methylase UbiE